MENILQGIPRVVVRVDDILITGKTRSEHIKHLQEVLSRLSAAGVRLKRRKCTFMAKEVIYLGYRVNAEGIHPIQEKLEAIAEMPHPRDVKELQSFLGMVNYYNRFLPNLSTVLVPLHKLLRKETKWKWGPEEQASWLSSKKLLSSSQLLVHFDSAKDLLLACDASPYGVGAVLSHRMEDGSDRPICKKFHQYLYGNKFQLYTDHKPLVGLLREDRQVPLMAAARIQRWALTLAAYEYTLVYKEGRRHCNADGLSRLPLTTKHRQPPIPGEVILAVEQLDETPVKAEQIKKWTSQDPNLSKVTMYVQSGWPNKCPDASLQPYFANRTELSIHDGCLLTGNRVIVPLKGQAQLLENLHEGHPGINRMKSLARCYVWWPHLDSDLEDYVKECALCQQNRKPPAEAPLHSWDWPNRPWSRLHIDYAGPFMGKMFLVIIDSHSKWLEVCVMNTSTSAATIQKLREVFATHGLPEMIVSDNGACFTSDEFENFMKQNNIRHTKTAPYHPASNGLAERAVQTLKDGLRKQAEGTIKQKLARFLLTYRITPQTTTGAAPCELLMGRRIRSKLDSVRPDMQARVTQKQTQQKHYHDLHSKERTFSAGDPVYVKNFVHNPKWLPGIIEEQTGPVSFRIKLDGGRIVRRHVDHVRIRYDKEPSTNHESQSELSTSQVEELPSETTDSIVPIPTTEPNTKNELCEQLFDAASSRPVRSHHVPVRFRDFVM